MRPNYLRTAPMPALPGPSRAALTSAIKRVVAEVVTVACWLIVLGLCGFAFVLFTLPAIPLLIR